MSVSPWLYALLFIAVLLVIALLTDRRAARAGRALVVRAAIEGPPGWHHGVDR